MKVKKLEWKEVTGFVYVDNVVYFYTIYLTNSDGINSYILHIKNNTGFKLFKTLEQAKQACQDHYEAFILSQIEEVKAFDPTLLGFKTLGNKPIKQNDSNFYVKDHYLIVSHANGTYEFRIDNFQMLNIKIPNHEFGVTLISQFLGDK